MKKNKNDEWDKLCESIDLLLNKPKKREKIMKRDELYTLVKSYGSHMVLNNKYKPKLRLRGRDGLGNSVKYVKENNDNE